MDNKNVISFLVSMYEKCIHIVYKLWAKGTKLDHRAYPYNSQNFD